MYYLPMHFDAYYQVLTSAAASLANLLNSVDKVIFVDFGCGPMTSGLAFGAYLKDIQASVDVWYYGIDNEGEMHRLASAFAGRGDVWGARFQSSFCSTWHQLPIAGFNEDKSERTAVILNFAYFFGQPLITDVMINDIAGTVNSIARALGTIRSYITYLNVNNAAYGKHERYEKLKASLNLAPGKPASHIYTFTSLRRNSDGSYTTKEVEFWGTHALCYDIQQLR
jgi:hypothetical protein